VSLQSSTINFTTDNLPDTYYFHRGYGYDLPFVERRKCPGLHLSRRIAMAGLPLLSLYKPSHTPLALTLGAVRVYNFGASYSESWRDNEVAYYGINTLLAISALAAAFFNRTAGALVTIEQEILIALWGLCEDFENVTYSGLLFSALIMANDALYLALLLSGGTQLAVASLALQVIVKAIQSIRVYQHSNDLIAAIGFLALALARGQQVRDLI
jgi:hypothetical protein